MGIQGTTTWLKIPHELDVLVHRRQAIAQGNKEHWARFYGAGKAQGGEAGGHTLKGCGGKVGSG